jgi:hypothetical protein
MDSGRKVPGTLGSPSHVDARRNCLNLNGVNAIKLEAAPRYQLRRFATRCSRLQRCAGAWRSCAFSARLAPTDVIARLARRASWRPYLNYHSCVGRQL